MHHAAPRNPGSTAHEALLRADLVEISLLRLMVPDLRRGLDRKAGFNPGQPRDDHGRWTSGGGSAGVVSWDTINSLSEDATWDRVVGGYDDTGDLIEQTVFNRDGSTIRSEFAGADAWDERHTVTTATGSRLSFETAGDTQTIADSETGDVVGRSTWTSAGPEPDASLQLARAPGSDPAVVIRKTIEAAAALYVWLSAGNDSGSTATFALNANEFKPGELPSANAIWVGRRSKDEVDAACPRHGEVQWRTDDAADTITREGNYLTASQYGTAVHKHLEQQIKSLYDPSFRAEVSLTKTSEESYGVRGSIRIDVYERASQDTVCVYDIKTGRSGLSAARTAEIAGTVASLYGPSRIIGIETRPRR
jgi:hypothetical protein